MKFRLKGDVRFRMRLKVRACFLFRALYQRLTELAVSSKTKEQNNATLSSHMLHEVTAQAHCVFDSVAQTNSSGRVRLTAVENMVSTSLIFELPIN